jgi:dTDP-glucose 4,6-dehydratase
MPHDNGSEFLRPVGVGFDQRRVLVTGAAGFIGSRLCEHLVGLGAVVVAVDNLATGQLENLASVLPHPHFTFVRRDVTMPFEVGGRLDFVFHLASPASPADYARLPLETLKAGAIGTLHALEIAERKAARLLLASTSEVYGDPLVHPQDERYWGHVNPVGPRSVYDEAKRFAEALVTCYRTTGRADSVIVRIFNTYGPRMRRDDGRAVPSFLRQARSGESLTVAGDGSQTRSLCYVDDTVEGLLRAGVGGLPGPVNIGSPHEISILALAEQVRDVAESSSSITFVPRAVDDPRRRCPDIAVARAELGWAPRIGLTEGLRKTLAWQRTSEPETGAGALSEMTGRGVRT